MDISKDYIKQCDCPEIQGQRSNYKDEKSWDGLIEERDEFIWLPRQDQIQAMIDGSWVIAFESFDEWYFNKSYPQETYPKTYPNDVFMSMEQMWLAFYMFKNHQKIWDGKKWVKSE